MKKIKGFTLKDNIEPDKVKVNNDEKIRNIILNNIDIYNKLLVYQKEHIIKLLNSYINGNRVLIDASDTGTGKTFSSLGFSRLINCVPFIICPKPVMNSWKKACDFFDIKPYSIINYDTLRNGKIIDEDDNKIKTNYIIKMNDKQYSKKVGIDDDDVLRIEIKGDKKTNQKSCYIWNLPKNAILIFDEAHKCKNNGTLNSQLLLSAKDISNPVLLLSATLIDKPDNFLNFAYLLGFGDTLYSTRVFLNKYQSDYNMMLDLHKKIFPEKGSRIQIKNLGNLFPDNLVISDCYTMEPDIEQEIAKSYEIIKKSIQDLKNKEKKDSENILTILLRARQKIEMLKLPTICNLIEDHLSGNYSVVVFLNFNESINILRQHYKLKETQLIVGNQPDEIRNKALELFQENKNKLLICNIQSGGTGVSLHDTIGGNPRVSLISPTWSSTLFVQTLGRIHRSGGKSKALQKIVFCAKTIEEEIAEKVKIKLKNLNLLNDGELSGIF